MREEITRELDIRSSSVALWFGALAGPIAFLFELQAKYGLVTYVCRNRADWVFWVAALVALIITIAGAFAARPYVASEDRRIHFMALAAVAIDAMFALAIIAMAVPDFFLKACD